MDSMYLDFQKLSLTVRINFCSFPDQGTSVRSLTLGVTLQGLKYSSPNGDRSIQRHIILLKSVTALRPTFPSDSKYVLGRWPWNRSLWPFASPGCVKIIRKNNVCTSVKNGSGKLTDVVNNRIAGTVPNWLNNSPCRHLVCCKEMW